PSSSAADRARDLPRGLDTSPSAAPAALQTTLNRCGPSRPRTALVARTIAGWHGRRGAPGGGILRALGLAGDACSGEIGRRHAGRMVGWPLHELDPVAVG